jgi:hypothetical protein
MMNPVLPVGMNQSASILKKFLIMLPINKEKQEVVKHEIYRSTWNFQAFVYYKNVMSG